MSALIVPISLPAAIDAFRLTHVPTARQGMPPHVTLLYPFLEPRDVDAAARGRIRAVAVGIPAFEFRLPSVRHWPTSAYLAVEPAEPFERLVRELVRAFPAFPPYAGEYPFVPHVSLAEDDATVPLDPIEDALDEVHRRAFRAETVVLVARDGGRWLPAEEFRLGDA